MDGSTRRSFIRGIAAAGASTAAAVTLDRHGAFFEATARAAEASDFSSFTAIAASAADRFEVPPGYRADVLIAYGDRFRDAAGNEYEYGYNNDFLAYFPLEGSREGLLFVNHEYPAPFFQHGYKPDAEGLARGKTVDQLNLERRSVGNSILHVRRGSNGRWRVVSPSRYNRRVYGGINTGAPGEDGSMFDVTGPLTGDPRVGRRIAGTLGNCSGGITPWGTALSCEENFDGYGLALREGADFAYGWQAIDPGYDPGAPYLPGSANEYARYGWVCEHDPYDPDFTPRKHTALGRFRHENTAFRHVRGKRFVLYMGDDRNNDAVYKFVSRRRYRPGDRNRAHNLRLLEEGDLYVARWEPEGRRRFANAGDAAALTASAGTGRWEKVDVDELVDTATLLRNRFGPDWDTHFATNRPEDVEVDPDTGDLFVALTNNSTVRDAHGSIRRLRERDRDPEATTFNWWEYAIGGPSGRAAPGELGFSAADNLTFDSRGNVWVVTDISSGTLNDPGPLQYHANNAVFTIPSRGPNAGVAFRFGNGPVEAECTGPYFTPDESTLFMNVQHPGEESGQRGSAAVFGQPATYSSWWPAGTPHTPRPATVVITKGRGGAGGENVIPRSP